MKEKFVISRTIIWEANEVAEYYLLVNNAVNWVSAKCEATHFDEYPVKTISILDFKAQSEGGVVFQIEKIFVKEA